MSQILYGKTLNEKIAKKLKAEISRLETLRTRGPQGRRPKLVIIQVGDNPESNAYIGRKIKYGEKIGAIVDIQKFPENVSLAQLTSKLQALNSDSSVHGIIVQLPISKHLDKDEIIESINPDKDVDGLTSVNMKRLWENKRDAVIPATTKGILTLLQYYKIPISRQKVVIIGRSTLVGKPTLMAFLNNDATVTVCHKATKNLPEHTKTADIIVVAAGKANFIGKEHVSPNQVVVDVGINVDTGLDPVKPAGLNPEPAKRALIGDVKFEEVSRIVKAITPVPGGIGPMTVASLFQNLLEAYKRQV